MDNNLWPPRKIKDSSDPSTLVLYNPNDFLQSQPFTKQVSNQGALQLPLKELSSTSVLIPPKKPRLVEPAESKLKIEHVPKDSSEIQFSPDYLESRESIPVSWQSWPTSHLVFPSITGSEMCPFPSQQNIVGYQGRTSTTPLYSVSGTQRLFDLDEPFNLKLEFPIPKYFHSYKNRKWTNRESTSTIDNGMKTNSKTMMLNEKRESVSGLPLKRPTYRLNNIPLRLESKYRLPVYLKEDGWDSQMEFKLKEMDEILRGHPPTKKIKIDVIVIASRDDLQNSRAKEMDLKHDARKVSEKSLKKNNSSFDFLYKDKRSLKQNNTSRVHFQDASSSETDDEMKTIEDEHPEMTDWDYPGFDMKALDENITNVHPVEANRSVERRSIERLKSTLKSRLLIPLRLIRSCKVWPESAENENKLRSGKEKAERSKTIFRCNSLNLIGSNNKHHRKSSGCLTIPISQKIELGVPIPHLIRQSYKDLQQKPNSPLDIHEATRTTTPEAVHPKSHVHMLSPKSSQPIDPKEKRHNDKDKHHRGVTDEPKTKIGKGSSEKTNASAVHKTKSPSMINGIFGLFRKSQEKQDCAEEPGPDVIQEHTNQHEQNNSIEAMKVQKSHTVIPASIPVQHPTNPNAEIQKHESVKTENADNKITKSPKKVSFLQTFFGFFHRKENVNKIQPEKPKQEPKRKTFLEKLGLKSRKPDPTPTQQPQEIALPPQVSETDADDQEMKLKLHNHTNSVSIIRKKRMKFFEETREFYEDSILAYRNVLGSQFPLDASTTSPSIVNPFDRLASTTPMVPREQSLGYKCTLSESVIMPAMSRRKRRLNQSFFSPEELIKDLLDEPTNANNLSTNTTNSSLKGILKNATTTTNRT